MASEEFVFGLRYTGHNQMLDLTNDLTHLSQVLAEARASASAGPQASQELLGALSKTVQGQFSKLEEVRLALLRANLAGQEVANKIANSQRFGYGAKGAEAAKEAGFPAGSVYKSLNEQLDAEARVVGLVSAKQRAFAAETAKADAALRAATSSQEAVARVGKIVQKGLSEQAVAGTQVAKAALDRAGLEKRLGTAIQQRVRADEAAARSAEKIAENTSRLASVDAELAARNPAPYRDVDPTTKLGVAQSHVNSTLAAQEVSARKLVEAQNSTTRTFESVRTAEIAHEAATRRVTVAENELALLQTRQSGGFGQQFQTGFKGATDRPYAEQIGQAFKFSVLYGAAYKVLFGITQALSGALQEGIAFQQSMTELNLASGQSVDELQGLSRNLGAAATQAGAAPSQGVLVGARSLGLFGAAAGSGATPAEQARIAEISARTVSRAAFGTGMQPEEIQRQLAAIAQAFQQGPEGQIRAYDLDAYLARRLGSIPGGTYQSVAESGTVGRAAGFSQEEITAIAADLQARTGQTDATVAGFMAQIFSRSGEGALVDVEQKYGVDATQNLAAQIAELAKVYRRTPEARDEISAAFGRGKIQNAAIALLQDYPTVQSAARGAQTGALGAGDQAFQLRLNNVGGQLQVFLGDIKALESELGRSGLLSVLGGAIKILDEFVQGLTGITSLWNELDGVTRSLIAAIIAEEIVRRSGLGSSALGALAGSGAAAGGRVFAVDAAGTATATATTAATLRAAAINFAKIAGPLAAIAGAGLVTNAARRLDTAESSTTSLLNKSNLGPDATAEDYQSRAAALNQQADEADAAAHSIFGRIVDLGQASARDADLADRATSEARRLQRLARDKQAFAASLPSSTPLITSFDSEGISAGLQQVTDAGGNAQDRFDALTASLNAGADAAHRASESYNAALFGGENAQPLLEKLLGTGYVGQTKPNGRLAAFRDLAAVTLPGLGTDNSTTNALPEALGNVLTPADIAKRYAASSGALGVTSLADITPRIASQLASDVVGDSPAAALKQLGITDPEQIAKLRALYVKVVKRALLNEAKGVKDIVKGKGSYTSGQAATAAGGLVAEAQNVLSGLQETDHGGRIDTLKRLVANIRGIIASTPGGSSQAQTLLDQARIDLSNAQIDELEQLRKVAQQNAHGKAQVAARGRAFLVREINNAVRANNQDRLVEIIGIAGKYAIDIARKAINDAIKAARAAIRMQQQMAAFAQFELNAISQQGRHVSGFGDPAAQQTIQDNQDLLESITASPHGTLADDPYIHGDFPGAGDKPDKPEKDPGPTKAQIAAARLSAYAQGSESQISQARAAIATARADMAAAKKGTTEYYSALGAYLSARNELTDAIQSYHQNLFLLAHDATDPVVQARAAARAAAAKLRSDAGKPADVRAADRVEVQSTQSELEAARFQKRLDAVQTAESLGRISFKAYINYLDREHDRLQAIKHRNYQQQQELNQIDQLLKEAGASMEGIWNFGDIDLPKPYQVRRYIEQKYGDIGSAGIGAGAARQVTSNTFHINGADTHMVLRILRDYIGGHTHLDTTAPRYR